jgi:hypothetical protein
MGVATGLLGGQLTNRSSIPGKGQRFVCSAVSRPTVGHTLLLVRGTGGLSSHEADHLLASSVDGKK